MSFLRNYCSAVYTTCQISQRKAPIEECVWKGGFLVWKQYADRNVNGAFEYAMAREASMDRQELQPDPKLIHPKDILLDITQISASSGTY